MRHQSTIILLVGMVASRLLAADDARPWPAPVPGWKAPKPGEHPRLLFRKADIPALRERAKTPEGQAILKRLRQQLNGSDGQFAREGGEALPGLCGHPRRAGRPCNLP